MAHGVHNVIEEECDNEFTGMHYVCETLKPAPDGQQLLQYIRNVTFLGKSKRKEFLIFPFLLYIGIDCFLTGHLYARIITDKSVYI